MVNASRPVLLLFLPQCSDEFPSLLEILWFLSRRYTPEESAIRYELIHQHRNFHFQAASQDLDEVLVVDLRKNEHLSGKLLGSALVHYRRPLDRHCPVVFQRSFVPPRPTTCLASNMSVALSSSSCVKSLNVAAPRSQESIRCCRIKELFPRGMSFLFSGPR